MKFQTIPFRILSLFSFWFFGVSNDATSLAWADSNDGGDLAALGLIVHWQSNIGGAPLANGSNSFVIWQHSTEKREYVTVRSGNRVIEQIRGEEVDQKAFEKAIESGERPPKPPTIGLDGARLKAEKLVANYKILGRKAEIDKPYSERLVYAVTLTSNGILATTDAETGALIWRTEAGNSALPMFGPGVSDEYVAVTNGNTLYVYELITGNIVTSRTLMFTPTAPPAVIGGKAIVPSVDGRTVAYDIKNKITPPGILRTGTENRLGLSISADHQFFSWPTGNRLVVSRMEKIPKLWNSANLHEPILALPIATQNGLQNGFLVSTISGTVLHFSTSQLDSLLWKSRLAVQVSQSPIANKDFAFIVSDDGLLYALRLADGIDPWGHQPKNIRNVIAVGKQHVYVTDSRNSLLSIDLATGNESGRTNLILPKVIPNAKNDRLFLVTNQGQITCLRETDATTPTFSTEFSGDGDAAPIQQKTKTEESQKKPADDDSSLFDGAGQTDSPDPFKTDPP